MAAALTIFQPTSAFQCTNRFRSRDRRKLGHQRLTSTSRTSTVYRHLVGCSALHAADNRFTNVSDGLLLGLALGNTSRDGRALDDKSPSFVAFYGYKQFHSK